MRSSVQCDTDKRGFAHESRNHVTELPLCCMSSFKSVAHITSPAYAASVRDIPLVMVSDAPSKHGCRTERADHQAQFPAVIVLTRQLPKLSVRRLQLADPLLNDLQHPRDER